MSILANTIWTLPFVYGYDTASALISFLVGFVAECGVFRLYTRALLPLRSTLRRIIFANLLSYIAGQVLVTFVPLYFRKDHLEDTALAFFIAFAITLPIEFCAQRSLLPSHRLLLLRAVTMSNFISYSILFAGYFLWRFNWKFLVMLWTDQ